MELVLSFIILGLNFFTFYIVYRLMRYGMDLVNLYVCEHGGHVFSDKTLRVFCILAALGLIFF